jgi:hypothetical protein
MMAAGESRNETKKNPVKSAPERRKRDSRARIAVSIRKGKLVFFPTTRRERRKDSNVDRGTLAEEAP